MSPHASKPLLPTEASPAPGHGLHEKSQKVGDELALALSGLLSSLFDQGVGPQKVADRLGQGVPMASRLLKALGMSDPCAMLYHVPGPDPLRRFVRAAGRQGLEAGELQRARDAVEAFAELVTEAGDRSGLNAILAAWVPDARRTFEMRRRQAAWRALSELKGALCATDLVTMMLHPSAEDPARLDVVAIMGRYGLRRLRPGVRVPFSTQRVTPEDAPRRPTGLDGRPADGRFDAVRLDDFCQAPPAPIESQVSGDYVLHVLGDSGFGPRSGVDVVVAEVDRAEMPRPEPGGSRRFFFHTPHIPARLMVFDLFVHQDIYPDPTPELIVTDITEAGVGSPTDPVRMNDRIEVFEEVQTLAPGIPGVRLPEVPRYGELLQHAYDQLGWEANALRGFRVRMEYPIPGMQVSFLLP